MDDATRIACAAVSAATAASNGIIEAIRSERSLGSELEDAEVTENLADALRHAINLELEVLPEGVRRAKLDQVLTACILFLEG